ncbi:MAG: RNA polymerase subunit sigma-70 [Planctomycetia bacterium 21-64-5]|nr:MAG: RNA polymerase subunit sigma-70 [Planctomycetia bacterium 21-64-5]HQU43445.1 sigma-70 family RNA polymerase sigma factor [Pirellulales bacterium]
MSYTIERTRTNQRANYVVSRTWSEMTDEELLSAYRESAAKLAFAELVQRYERELYNYLRRYLGDPVMAEDAFQGTFLQLHLKCDQFEPDKKVRPWLYMIATNQAIDAQRRNKRHRLVSLDRRNSADDEEMGTLVDLLVSKEVGPADQMESDERREWVRNAVSELPPTLLSAVTLIYYQGLKYREAAEILDVPVGTVKSRLHAAILKLHEAWNHAQPSGEN